MEQIEITGKKENNPGKTDKVLHNVFPFCIYVKSFQLVVGSILFFCLPLLTSAQTRISELITLTPCEDIKCDEANFKSWLDTLLKNTFCSNLQFTTSVNNDTRFFSFNVMGKKEFNITFPGTDIRLLMRMPGKGMYGSRKSQQVSVTVENNIKAYKTKFKPAEFDFTPYSYYSLGLQIFGISEDEAVANFLNKFVESAKDYKVSKLKAMILDVNKKTHSNFPVPTTNKEDINWIITQFRTKYPDVFKLLFEVYLQDKEEVKTIQNMNRFFGRIAYDDIITYVNKTINITAKLGMDSAETLLIPNDFISPVYSDTATVTKLLFKTVDFVLDRAAQKMTFTFNIKYADTMIIKKGIYDYYSMEEGKIKKKKIPANQPLRAVINQFRIEVYLDRIKGFLVADYHTVEILDTKINGKK